VTLLSRAGLVVNNLNLSVVTTGAAMASSFSDISVTIDRYTPGARVGDDGVRYCVWAPQHPDVRVKIHRVDGRADILPLESQTNGYSMGEDRIGKAGDRYLYILDNGSALPDPASRFQPEGVHAWSECIDPRTYSWRCAGWQRPGWHGQAIYEIHLGTFTTQGTYRAAISRLDHVAALGVGAIEIMPVADFPGERNWGYDGVALFAPARCYGRPDELRALVDGAHERGLAVILDVVYNHLGPDGNYLPRFADAYFHADRATPWGQGFNLDGPGSKPVRDYFLSNVAYWLEEFRFDGLRLDATHMMHDHSPRHLLAELADLAHERGAFLIAEDERNSCEVLSREDGGGAHIDAVWADDFHHQVRVALTGIQEAYFRSYGGSAAELARTLANGWFYTGQPFPFWNGRPRGESCRHLPPSTFVTCIENHDQIGNRARGERLEHLIGPAAYRAASALLCLTPYPPLIFMGQEWAASTPFLFFVDHAGELGAQVSAGRRKEFADTGLNQRLAPEEVPDPQDPETFLRSKLSWDELRREPHATVFELYRRCLGHRVTWLRGKATQRSAWSVAAFERAIAIRYASGEQPERLVVSSLYGDTRLSLISEPLLRPPDGCIWRLEFESSATCLDAHGFPPSMTATAWTHVEERRVETLVFRAPATVLLVARLAERAGHR
jgi:maltooligosyltrehalose trehalohydrolase